MKKAQPFIRILDLPDLIESAEDIACQGSLALSPDSLLYLNIDDAFVHKLFPLLKTHFPKAIKPKYFSEKLAGAHISVIYPEEKTVVDAAELGQEYQFTIYGVGSVDIENKRYYLLRVKAASLINLRKKYHLGSQLSFKKNCIDLHITLGIELL